MRKGLATGAIVASMMLAGCSSGGAETPPTDTGGESSAIQTPTSEVGPERTAPAKSLELANKCSIVTESQWRNLGGDQPPNPRESNGRAGCNYQKGQAGTIGWSVFVAVDSESTFDQEVENPADITKVAGYPVSEDETAIGCVVHADVSDSGFLIANITKVGTADPGVDLCQHAEKFAKAAVENLPNEGA